MIYLAHQYGGRNRQQPNEDDQAARATETAGNPAGAHRAQGEGQEAQGQVVTRDSRCRPELCSVEWQHRHQANADEPDREAINQQGQKVLLGHCVTFKDAQARTTGGPGLEERAGGVPRSMLQGAGTIPGD